MTVGKSQHTPINSHSCMAQMPLLTEDKIKETRDQVNDKELSILLIFAVLSQIKKYIYFQYSRAHPQLREVNVAADTRQAMPLC